jgi:uncharacterized membrane protein YcaP (DUF421 family)
MEIFLRTFTIYLFLLVIFRLSGKRTLSELSTFDFILLLIISEATQNALIEEDYSLTRGLVVILILVLLDLTLSILKKRFRPLEKFTEGAPIILVDHGKLAEKNLAMTHVTHDDIMQTARLSQGLERMEQIKYAVLENSGGISIIPMDPDLERLLDRRIEAALKRIKGDMDDATGGP